MTTTYNCALCNQPLSIVGNSGEHIVPNSIGGRRKVRGFICKGCNSRTGDGWDAELWRQFQHIALMHGVERDRGNVPAIPVQTGVGTQLMLLPDGSLMPRRIAFEKVANPAGKGFLIKATVRTAEEAEEMVRNLAAKHPEINVEEVLSTLQARAEYLDSPLTFGTAFAGPLGGRSMVKTAVAMAFDAGVSPSACNLALPYLLDKNSEAPYGLFYERDLVRGRPTSFTPHIVSVRGDSSSGYLMGYVEYFGLARIVVPLSDQYDGEALSLTYAFDPANGQEIDISVDLYFSGEEIERIKANEAYTVEQYEAVVNSSFRIVYRRSLRRQYRKAFAGSVEYAASKLGIAYGEVIPATQAREFAEHMMERLGPLFAHMAANGIPIAEAMRTDDVD
ncbi:MULTISPECIES: HNH endonuclease [Burkholderia]|uniref:HNH endonuclease n=1 Tax=Burkholderia TaxID=32008 RepID=UPI0009BE1EE3|nr:MULTISPECIES: HNH endonuclease [Burkholderia]MCA7946171.1 HNH endonuclease [Burkholderia vietnamiensis]HDR8968629.1 HNH endonuclease [Burkholderia vietnamiensis]HDR9144405.1 HNH endonuclease [Burkholderia vietnamiensis]HDR9218856.1 HNH endonuclease [Burkholderia vietnamiensis]